MCRDLFKFSFLRCMLFVCKMYITFDRKNWEHKHTRLTKIGSGLSNALSKTFRQFVGLSRKSVPFFIYQATPINQTII